MNSNLNRRDFSKLAAAAFGGVLSGVGTSASAAAAEHDPQLLLKEPHVCRGLNTCKGKEAKDHGADNACAGQGQCATVKAHQCKGENACKGQGGCGEYPGQNACKAMGACAVPLEDKIWKTARKAFEAQMKKAGKKFGDAPPPPKKS